MRMEKVHWKSWCLAVRPKTLPLSMSSTILGSFLAGAEGKFRLDVFILASITTLLLQVLSNLANDYGDFVSGTDSAGRIGPKRMVQSGSITPRQMIGAIIAVVVAVLISGIALIRVGTAGMPLDFSALFFILGLLCVMAALKYTIGKNPYGYRSLGDISVFIFFGLVGAIGTFFLHTHEFRFDVFLPAASIGFLSTGVLNLNNMRDCRSDEKAMKRTVALVLGNSLAKIYHAILILSAVAAGLLYTLLNFKSVFQFLFILPLPFLYLNVRAVLLHRKPAELNVELQKLSFSTILFALCFGLGLVIG